MSVRRDRLSVFIVPCSNLMPSIIDAVKAYASLGEICDVFRSVWGQYREDGRY